MKSVFVRLALLLYIAGSFIMLSSAQNGGNGNSGNSGGGNNGSSNNSTSNGNNNTTSNTNNTNTNGGNNGPSNSTSSTTTVTITQPYGGESLVAGQDTNITWSAQDVSSDSPSINLDILLGQGSGSRNLSNIASGLSLSSKILTWTVGRQFTNNTYTIRLYSADNTVNTYSQPFRIINYEPQTSPGIANPTSSPTGTSGNSGSSGSSGSVLDNAAGRYISSSLFMFWAIVTSIFFVL